MKNDFEELFDKLVNSDFNTVSYDFIKSWVGKTDGIITIDGVTLSVFDKPNMHFTLRVWWGTYFVEFTSGTLFMVTLKALGHLSGKHYESNTTAVQTG